MCKRPFSVKRCAYIILHGEAQNIQIKGQKKGEKIPFAVGGWEVFFFSFLSITSKSKDSECTTSTTTTTTAAAVTRAESHFFPPLLLRDLSV